MKKLRIMRDLLVIYALAFTAIILVTTIAGAEHSNTTIGQAFLVSFCYAVLALFFFWEGLVEKIGYLPIEIFYVLMLNVTYIVLARVFVWDFSTRGYAINFCASIVAYIFIKLIIFSIDTLQAEEINEIIQKRRRKGSSK